MKRRWRWFVLAVPSTMLVATVLIAVARPPIAFTSYKVWDAVPGSVTDSDGRVGQLYRAPHGAVAVVVFNKGKGPRQGGSLDRFLTPGPDSDLVYFQCTVNVERLYAGDSKSDEVFRGFLLSRIDGDGWASDSAGIATFERVGDPSTYRLFDFTIGRMPKGYQVTFQVRG